MWTIISLLTLLVVVSTGIHFASRALKRIRNPVPAEMEGKTETTPSTVKVKKTSDPKENSRSEISNASLNQHMKD